MYSVTGESGMSLYEKPLLIDTLALCGVDGYSIEPYVWK